MHRLKTHLQLPAPNDDCTHSGLSNSAFNSEKLGSAGCDGVGELGVGGIETDGAWDEPPPPPPPQEEIIRSKGITM